MKKYILMLGVLAIGWMANASPAMASSSIAPSRNHTCYIVKGGVECIGRPTEGQSGGLVPGVSLARPKIILPPGSNVVKVASRGEFNCALKFGGSVVCWGQMKDDGIDYAPAQVFFAASVLDIAVGDDHACALLSTHEVQCWGSNDFGQLARNDVADDWSDTPVYAQMRSYDASNNPIRVRLDHVISLVAGEDHNCVLRDNGNVRCWGSDNYGNIGNGTSDEATTCLNGEPCRRIAVAVTNFPVGSGATSLGGGYNHTCALKSDGSTWCWGLNSSGQLGNGNQVNSFSPVRVAIAIPLQYIVGGEAHTCGYTAGRVFCWGNNANGQVNGSPSASPVLYPTEKVFPGVAVTGVSTGANNSCVTLADAAVNPNYVFCMGDNSAGQSVPLIKTPPKVSILIPPTGPNNSTSTTSNQIVLDAAVSNYIGSASVVWLNSLTKQTGPVQPSPYGWIGTVPLAPGKNVITFLVADYFGRLNADTITVYYKLPDLVVSSIVDSIQKRTATSTYVTFTTTIKNQGAAAATSTRGGLTVSGQTGIFTAQGVQAPMVRIFGVPALAPGATYIMRASYWLGKGTSTLEARVNTLHIPESNTLNNSKQDTIKL